jgi:hypothetical protein
LKITDSQNGSLSMNQLLTVSGDDVGSTFIDAEFQRHIESRLAPIEHHLNQSLQETSWEIMKSRDYLDNKCTFGDHEGIERFFVKIPELPKSYNYPDLGIQAGQMEIRMCARPCSQTM